MLASSLQIGPILAKFPVFSRRLGNFAGRDAFAPASQHSHPVAGFPALSRPSLNSPEEARKRATDWLWSCLKRAERGKSMRTKEDFRGASGAFSQLAYFGGHTWPVLVMVWCLELVRAVSVQGSLPLAERRKARHREPAERVSRAPSAKPARPSLCLSAMPTRSN